MLRHAFDKTILREYDIRGIVGDSLNNKDAKMLGYFFGSIVKINTDTKPTIVVSRDGRLSSEILSSNLLNGLKKAGANIIDIGLNPTPVLYFANKYFSADAAIQVTGSHNPKNYNGFKIVINDSPVSGIEILNLISDEFTNFKNPGNEIVKKNIMDEYINEVISQADSSAQKMKIVVDCGNGSAGEIAPKLMRKLGHQVVELFCKIDGNFPNHHPDPGKIENLQDLIKLVKSEAADIGIAFYVVVDRVGFVSKK